MKSFLLLLISGDLKFYLIFVCRIRYNLGPKPSSFAHTVQSRSRPFTQGQVGHSYPRDYILEIMYLPIGPFTSDLTKIFI